jgi:NAD(P)-dependent dehydrogenase (short-subunit alcohol dehydrogenase family)
VPKLRERDHASIVNIGALGALSGQAAMSAYCAAKSTVMRLTESLSEELKSDGINVNAVLPSIIDTQPNREAMPDADFDTWVSPAQLAEVICFLASERARAIHGALLPVKGLV